MLAWREVVSHPCGFIKERVWEFWTKILFNIRMVLSDMGIILGTGHCSEADLE